MPASVHGVVRASPDADVVVSLPLSALPGLERIFQAAGFQTERRRGDADDPIGSLLEHRDEFGNRVDLLVGLRGLEDAAFAKAIEVAFEGEILRVVGREDFIAMKVFAAGHRILRMPQMPWRLRRTSSTWCFCVGSQSGLDAQPLIRSRDCCKTDALPGALNASVPVTRE